MWRTYSCPNCRARIVYGYRFCGNCGVKLDWQIQQTTTEPSPHNQSLTRRAQNQYQASGTTTPIRTEILKLLTEIFDNQIKYN
jgi:hypothetical protein